MGPSKKASEIAALLNLRPHPDGGFYLETLRDSSITLARAQLPSPYKVDRPISTAIYFLLPAGSVAYLHRIPCAETFHFYMGEPLTHSFALLESSSKAHLSDEDFLLATGFLVLSIWLIREVVHQLECLGWLTIHSDCGYWSSKKME